MKKALILAMVLLVPAIVEARPYSPRHRVRVLVEQAESSIDRDIELEVTAEKTIAWVDKNRDAMRKAAGLEVLEDLGNGKFKVRKVSPKGTFVWITQESIETRGDRHVFKSKLIESIEGGIVYSNSEVTITTKGRAYQRQGVFGGKQSTGQVKSNAARHEYTFQSSQEVARR